MRAVPAPALALLVALATAACAPTSERVSATNATPSPTVAAQDAAAVDTEALGDDLALITGPGGNVLVAHDASGAFVVDTMDAESAPAVLAAVDALGAGPRRLALNTHWHADHTDGNPAFAEAGVTLVAHANVRARRASTQEMPDLKRSFEPLPPHALPALTYTTRLTLHTPAGRVDLHHLPAAHTDGDSLAHFVDRDLLHTGDLFEGDDFPYLDLASGGSLSGLIDALEAALALCGPDTRVVPGHGAVATPDALRRTRDMLVDVRTRLTAALDAGADPQELFDSAPLADLPAHWGDGFISVRYFTYLALTSLAAEREAAAADAGDTSDSDETDGEG